ncbi:hypothetical protein CONPUDRAFT_72351 [Coniophora puteana RWD-64-598 SS2]|uniref:Uncharacterized protein n=1 Tax=Coniophora puteana (strain RWD-64-598) TaxID=741705 RepID=A0A5M3MTD3_CONPW|nr:uncharacterized protein CONPUDRAFT_72351 [Coniophora puteana RWD-64-598 SS2]EIW82014.1 hypothetical protein CONPUDRAFT_72351 [Coniophora puteana RWD-64-598 SS2]
MSNTPINPVILSQRTMNHINDRWETIAVMAYRPGKIVVEVNPFSLNVNIDVLKTNASEDPCAGKPPMCIDPFALLGETIAQFTINSQALFQGVCTFQAHQAGLYVVEFDLDLDKPILSVNETKDGLQYLPCGTGWTDSESEQETKNQKRAKAPSKKVPLKKPHKAKFATSHASSSGGSSSSASTSTGTRTSARLSGKAKASACWHARRQLIARPSILKHLPCVTINGHQDRSTVFKDITNRAGLVLIDVIQSSNEITMMLRASEVMEPLRCGEDPFIANWSLEGSETISKYTFDRCIDRRCVLGFEAFRAGVIVLEINVLSCLVDLIISQLGVIISQFIKAFNEERVQAIFSYRSSSQMLQVRTALDVHIAMPTCNCETNRCSGKLISAAEVSAHEKADLQRSTAKAQALHQARDRLLPPQPPLHAHPEQVHPTYYPINYSQDKLYTPIVSHHPFSTSDDHQLYEDPTLYEAYTDYYYEQGAAIPYHLEGDEDKDEGKDEGEGAEEEQEQGQWVSLHAEDLGPDPFKVEDSFCLEDNHHSLYSISPLNLAFSMLVAWLHLSYHLPVSACNIILSVTILVLVRLGVSHTDLPFKTLQSTNILLGIDRPICLLAVCPCCQDVYPSASSEHVQEICVECNTPLFLSSHMARGNKRLRVPVFKYPSLPLSTQIRTLLKLPGIEGLLDAWRVKEQAQGTYMDTCDGEVTKCLKDPAGKPFFLNAFNKRNGSHGELRIGVNLSLDWLSYIRSNTAPSHTSGPVSFSVCNLPPEYRYCTANVIPASAMEIWPCGANGIMPQSFFMFVMYRPLGRHVHVILVAVVGNKAAAHKVGGYGSHSHTNFDTLCWISISNKAMPDAFREGVFPTRTDQEQQELGELYRNLPNQAKRAKFAHNHATRFSQLSRLPYFDLVKQIVIDPMHNLFLGVVKTHFYNIWVQHKILCKQHELADMHHMIADFIVPTSCGKLPVEFGEPAGGSLTADQWMLLCTIYRPVLIPQVWDLNIPQGDADKALVTRCVTMIACQEADKQAITARKASQKAAMKQAKELGPEAHEAEKLRQEEENLTESQRKETEKLEKKAKKAKEKAEVRARKKQQNRKRKAPGGDPEPEPSVSVGIDEGDDENDKDKDNSVFSLHPQDPIHFLQLSQALQILLRRQLTDLDITWATNLICLYTSELLTLYGTATIKPNHHYATHIGECVQNFGPLHNFWTFLFERLNWVLKSYNVNNCNKGKLEMTFFREFHRTCEVSQVVCAAATMPPNSVPAQAARMMLKVTQEERGTVASLGALSKDLDEAHEDAGVNYQLSAQCEQHLMSSDTYRLIAAYVNSHHPELPVHCHGSITSSPNSLPLTDVAVFHQYAILRSK